MDDKQVVLILDDEPGARYVLETLLPTEGHEILLARNGEEALAQVEKLTPDVILLDVMMPGMDGFEMCQRLKADQR